MLRAMSAHGLLNVVAFELLVVDDGIVGAEDVVAEAVRMVVVAGEHPGEDGAVCKAIDQS